jgi:hypothetical protein
LDPLKSCHGSTLCQCSTPLHVDSMLLQHASSTPFLFSFRSGVSGAVRVLCWCCSGAVLVLWELFWM